MHWPPKLKPSHPCTLTPRGYVATIRGKTRWICGKKSPEEAERRYHKLAASLAGAAQPMPEPSNAAPDLATMRYILGKWVILRRADCLAGDISLSIWTQYKLSGKRIEELVGHYRCNDWTPDQTDALFRRLEADHSKDFARRAIGHLRTCCVDAEDKGWCRAVRLGTRTVAKLASRPKATMKWRLYTREEIRRILAASLRSIRRAGGPAHRAQAQQFHAMLLLALNGGYGATELAELPKAVIDIANRRIDYRRGKTGEEHIVPLWEETIRALQPVLAQRPADEILFRTMAGNLWAYSKPGMKAGKLVRRIGNDNCSDRFDELVKPLGLKFPRQNFAKLRHLMCTTADAFKDRNAVSVLMGHSLGIKDHYVIVSEERLRDCAEYVRAHLIIKLR